MNLGTTIREYDAPALMQFACGFDSLSGEVKGTAVTGMPGPTGGGRQVIFSLFKVESIEDFLSVLEISASASVQAGFGRGGAKAKYARTLKTNRYSLYIAAVVTVRSGTRQLQNPALEPSAAQLLTTEEGREQFRTMYGDEYLAGVTVGGEFIGFIEIRTSNRTEQEEISASVSGSDAIGANRGSASFSSFIQQISARSQLRVSSFQNGGNEPNPVATPDALIEKALAFPATVAEDSDYSYLATFQTYDILPRPAGANPIDVQNRKDWLEKLGLYRLRYQRVTDSIEYVLDNPQQFKSFNSAALSAKRNELNGVINDLMNKASQCFNDYSQCGVPVDLPDPVVELPERLTKEESGAIELAKQATAKAQGHALAAKGHAARVIEISQTVKPSPMGKSLADEAKLEAQNAKAAAQLAQNAADAAIVAVDVSPLAGEYAALAKSAAQQANQASQLAQDRSAAIYKVGYAPYWKIPTVIRPTFRTGNYFGDGGPTSATWSFRRIVWGNVQQYSDTHGNQSTWIALDQLAVDPRGGEMELLPLCDNPVESENSNGTVHNKYCVFKNTDVERFQFWTSKYDSINADIGDYYHVIVENQADLIWGTVDEIRVKLRSKTSGLETIVTLMIYNSQSAVGVPVPHVTGQFDIVE